MNLRDLNIKRRRALVEYLIKYNFKEKGYRVIDFIEGAGEERINLTDGEGLILSFDLSTAADYKQDAYTWCYLDIFIYKSGIELPDELKRMFSRYIYIKGKRIYWRHRLLTRIIDMDLAVDYILKNKENVERLLIEHDIDIRKK